MLIIVDRDGVINFDSPDYIKSLAEWQPIPGSLEAMAKLSQQGHQVAVATNQSGLGRHYFTEDALLAIHQKMQALVTELGGRIDHIAVCPHLPDDHCECRKPKPGLIVQTVRKLQADIKQTIFIGDSERDLQAAFAAGCAAWLVKTGNGEKTWETSKGSLTHVPVFKNLAEAVDSFIQATSSS